MDISLPPAAPEKRSPRKTKRGRWLLLGMAFLLGFVFIPGLIRQGYHLTSNPAEIELLRQRYQMLEATESALPEKEREASGRRRFEIAAWLAMRDISIDDGVRDEGVENAPYFIALFGYTRWQWEDLFRYWSQPASQRNAQNLLSSGRTGG